ncbi:NTPase KAP family P-loop domain-containing protein 1-like [Protobothrops mucrosquamatus]|uniref:NTPase KAP family P-loop domain-containing protein 1-like n=1 Tax=Protobothrops mucrosquamatus TaxID=103944 RepID=UPI0007758E1A|nr:NTPase KAP family P-loop domain-containing protein 1-like [Protobothrops mucrosquamatus]
MSNYDEEAARLPHAEKCHEMESLSSNKDSPFSHNECNDEDHQSGEDIYCSSLVKILCNTSTPVIVGFCSSYKARLRTLLNKIQGNMSNKSIQKEEKEFSSTCQTSRAPKGINYLILLWHIIFYQPVITKKHRERKNFDFLFIQFSAWEYACNKQLWAGLITTLCDQIRNYYSPLPLSFYQVVGSNPQSVKGATQEWRLKKKTCWMAVGLLLIVVLTVAGLATVIFLVPEIRDGTYLKYLGSSMAAILGSGFIIAIGPVIKNLIISQKKKIESMTSDEKFTKHLGFRSAVKREIEVLTNFIRYMDIFDRRHLKIVIEITSLDICYPEQVVGVLNAIHTLLSDKDSPFIFILVVDPCIIVSCLENAESMKGMADNGYLYLNRIMTLPFSIPEIAIESKRKSLQDTLKKLEVLISTGNLEEANIREAFKYLQDEKDCLYHYVPDNINQMTRISNTIILMIRLMTQQHLLRNKRCIQNVASWVVLANQWPCRLSWILQCMEDKQQCQPPNGYEKRLMWAVFVETCSELFSKHKELQNMMALDGDPELFENFLSGDFHFTVEEGNKFLKYTVNLDRSIKFKMGQLRALATLEKDYSKDGANSEEKA